MIELTSQQRHALEMTGWPPLVVNPVTLQTFVLLPVELYDRVRALLEAQDAAAYLEPVTKTEPAEQRGTPTA